MSLRRAGRRRPACFTNTAEQRDWLKGVIERTVAHAFEIQRASISQPTRGAQTVAQARQVAMYLAHVGLGLTMRDTGSLFERDRTTVRHAVRMIEDRRDRKDFDRAMDVLQEVVIELSTANEEEAGNALRQGTDEQRRSQIGKPADLAATSQGQARRSADR